VIRLSLFEEFRFLSKDAASLHRAEVEHIGRWVVTRRVPISPSAAAGTHQNALCVRDKIVGDRPSIFVEAFGPVQLRDELLGIEILSVGPIQNVEEAVALR